MAQDRMLKIDKCDRCDHKFKVSRRMSWFTTEIICEDCGNAEDELRGQLPYHGRDFEGCGFIPHNPLDINILID